MTIKEIEVAMPGLTDPTSFGLEDEAKNKKKLAELKKKDAKIIGRIKISDSVLPLSMTGDNDGAIFLEYSGLLGLYIKYHTYHYQFLPSPSVMQIRLWKSPDLPITNTFSPRLFFNIIPKQTGAVLSDIEHTDDGIEFWKRRTREALQKGLNVALVDFGNRSYKQIKGGKELDMLLEQTWGGGMDRARFLQLRWLIWK